MAFNHLSRCDSQPAQEHHPSGQSTLGPARLFTPPKKEACRNWHASRILLIGSGRDRQCRFQPFTGFHDYWHPVKFSAWVVVIAGVGWSLVVPAEIVVAGAVISSGLVQSGVVPSEANVASPSIV